MTEHKQLYRRHAASLVIEDPEAMDRALDDVLADDFVAHDLPGVGGVARHSRSSAAGSTPVSRIRP